MVDGHLAVVSGYHQEGRDRRSDQRGQPSSGGAFARGTHGASPVRVMATGRRGRRCRPAPAPHAAASRRTSSSSRFRPAVTTSSRGPGTSSSRRTTVRSSIAGMASSSDKFAGLAKGGDDLPAGAAEPGADSSLRDARGEGHLGIAHVADRGQQQHVAVPGRQSCESGGSAPDGRVTRSTDRRSGPHPSPSRRRQPAGLRQPGRAQRTSGFQPGGAARRGCWRSRTARDGPSRDRRRMPHGGGTRPGTCPQQGRLRHPDRVARQDTGIRR
jgi:hypothetical protein